MIASAPLGPRSLHLLKEFHANFGWRRIALAVGISLVLSTQLLFQASVLDEFTFAETFDALWPYFLDILTIAIMLAAGVAFVDTRLPNASGMRTAALVFAGVFSILIGSGIQLSVHYGLGPYPPVASVLGEATRWFMIGGASTLIYESTRRRQRHLQQLHAAELRQKILDNQMIDARIKMMEAQIEPHFLFNTLATVKRLYKTEPTGGAKMISRLKEYLRAALPQIRHGIPTLATEIELVRAYLGILQMRMGPRLAYSVDAPTHLQSTPFPCMVLITLVENSIKHGLNPMPNGGRIDIRVLDMSNAIVVEVADDGVGIQAAASTSGTGIGLSNIRSRLKTLYGTAASMVLFQNRVAGVTVRVEIAKGAIPVLFNDGRKAA